MSYDLETLRLIWWAILGLLAIGLAVGEGISLGMLMLLPLVDQSPASRNSLIASIAPVSVGNMAWLTSFITVLFAAWPIAYAVALTSLQPALLLIVLTALPRPLCLYFYHAQPHPKWQASADKILLASGWIPAAMLGLLVGNLLKGIPFHLESDMHIAFLGDFMSLLNPFSLLVAATCLALLIMHGASYGQLKFNGQLQQQAIALQLRAGIAFIVLFGLTGLWVTHLEGYHISSEILSNANSNPLAKFVKRGEGLWLDNYEHQPLLIAIPLAAFCSVCASLWLAKTGRSYYSMLLSSIAVAMTLLTAGVSMFPFLLPSNLSLNSSLTIWDSSASLIPLQVLLPVALTAIPALALSNRWLFGFFAGKTAAEEVDIDNTAEPQNSETSSASIEVQ
jgi:cytochrome d ubiquinol oxidase subunit II